MKRRAVIIEDDPGRRRSLAEVLERAGYEVRLAGPGDAARDDADVLVLGRDAAPREAGPFPHTRGALSRAQELWRSAWEGVRRSALDRLGDASRRADELIGKLGVDPVIDRVRDRLENALLLRDLEEDLKRKNRALEHLAEELRRANAELLRLAVTDALTGMNNRRHFMEGLRREFRRAERYRRPLSLLLLDVDHFKAINDTYGHPAGDAVLVGLAGLIKGSIRASDIAARLGGEEFAIAYVESDLAQAAAAAEALRHKISQARFTHGGAEVRITVSGGVIDAPREGVSSHLDLLEHADRLLYGAKTGGRDRVVAAPAALSGSGAR
jgi:diguanylate cyclase (GGDEF)-like protein